MSRIFWLSVIVILYFCNAVVHFVQPHNYWIIATIYLGLAVANANEFLHLQRELDALSKTSKHHQDNRRK